MVTLLLLAAVVVTIYYYQPLTPVQGAPTIGLSPSSGPPGTVVTVSGIGFSSSDNGCVITGTGGIIGSSMICAMSGGSGTLGVSTFKVGNVAPGIYTVTVTGSPMSDSGQTTFTVTAPTITLYPSLAPVGNSITVVGNGFALTDTSCTVSGTPVSSPPASCIISSGTLTTLTFTVGSVPLGSYPITVNGDQSGDSAKATLTVIAGPILTLTPNSGPIGTSVSVTGSAFLSTDTTPCVLSGTGSVIGPSGTCTIVLGSGAAHDTFTVGSASPGTYLVSVTGTGNDVGQAAFTIPPIPARPISLNPSSAQVHSTVHVSGSGFASGDTSCLLTSLPSGAIASPLCSISGGVLTATFVVGNVLVSGNPFIITATGTPVGDTAAAAFTLLPPTITLTPSIGQVGITVSVSGSGFLTTDSTCSFSGGGSIATSSCSISGGSLSGSFTVANVAAGVYPITANTGAGLDSGIAVANFQVTVNPKAIALSPSSAQVGATVQVSGSGFSAGDTSCTLTGGGAVASYTCSVTGGVLTGSFKVANVVPSPYLITATGDQISDAAPAVTLTVLGPSITLTPFSGQAASIIQVSGSGFWTTDTTCSLSDGGSIATSSCSISGGSLSGSFTVAAVADGIYVIAATGLAHGDQAVASLIVTSNSAGATIFLNPVSASPGFGLVKVGGSVFTHGTCTLSSSGGLTLASPECSVNSFGNLEGNFTILTSAIPGTYVIKATDSASLFAEAVFTVTSGVVTTTTGIVTSIATFTSPSCTFTTTTGATFTTISGCGTYTGMQFITVSVSPTSTGPGFFVTVSGSGFNPTDNLCVITVETPSPFSGTCSFTGPNSGTITGSFLVPSPGPPPGTYEVFVEGNGGDAGFTSIVIAEGATSTSIFTSYTSTSTFTTTTSTTSTSTGFSTSFSTSTVSSTGASTATYTVYSQTTQTGPTTTSITNSPTTTYLVNRTTTGGTTYLTITIPSTVTVTGFITGVVAQTSNASAPDYVGVLGLLVLLGWSLVRRVWA